MPTTRAMTRLLNGSRNSVCTTRGEYWLDASWMMSSEIEKAIPAKVMVAPATVLSTALALSTVDVNPSGRSVAGSRCRSRSRATSPKAMAPTTASIGKKNRLARTRSSNELSRRRIAPFSRFSALAK